MEKHLKELALVAFCAVALAGIGSFIHLPLLQSGSSLAAATALSDQQGALTSTYTYNYQQGGAYNPVNSPSYQAYPADVQCFVNYSYLSYGEAYHPACPGFGYSFWGLYGPGDTDTFPVGAFSVDVGGGAGQTAWQSRTYAMGGNQKDVPPSCPKGTTLVLDQNSGTWTCQDANGNWAGAPTCPDNDMFLGGVALSGFGNGGEPYCYKSIPSSFSGPSDTQYAGSGVSVASGAPIALEWSCLPSRTVIEEGKGNGSWCFFGCTGGWSTRLLYGVTLASSAQLRGPGVAGEQEVAGSMNISAPNTPGVYDYTLTCRGGSNSMTIPVTVSGAAVPFPTLSITGNGKTNPDPVNVGQSVIVAATFAAGTSDSLTKSAINDSQSNLWCGSGQACSQSMWTASPLGQKSYTFTPTAPGTYVFYPAAQTAAYPQWNNYGKSLTITVGGGSCPGAHQVNYPTCNCDVGYAMQNGQCVLQGCADPHATPPACTCDTNYVTFNGKCTAQKPTLSIWVAQKLITKGSPASLSWSATGLVAGSAETCSVRSDPAGVFSADMPAGTGPIWNRNNQPTGSITGRTVFTLSCQGGVPASASVTVLLNPTFIEH